MSRELDAAVAEKILGCVVHQYKHGPECVCPSNEHGKTGVGDHHERLRGPLNSYFTAPTWALAGEVIEAMLKKGYQFNGYAITRPQIDDAPPYSSFCTRGGDDYEAEGFGPKAIVLAACKAVGLEVPE